MGLYKRLLCLFLQAHFATFENHTLYFSLENDGLPCGRASSGAYFFEKK